MTFEVDLRIQTDCHWVTDGPLSKIYLKNDRHFPWLILVPQIEGITEMFELTAKQQQQLISEISILSEIMHNDFSPDKLNIGALGNIVAQLHVHIVARRKTDCAWPHGVWRDGLSANAYEPPILQKLLLSLKGHIDYAFFNKTDINLI